MYLKTSLFLLTSMKRKSSMGTDNSFMYGYPKPKKSKTSRHGRIRPTSYWAQLPSLLLHEIFDKLDAEDRMSASLVCKHWRQHSFHPKWWTTFTFNIEENNTRRNRFCNSMFSRTVSDVKIKLNSLSSQCVQEFIYLLQMLSENRNLRSLYLEPTHCRFEAPTKYNDYRYDDNELWGVIPLLKECLPNLTKFSIGCLEDLTYCIDEFLKILDPKKVTHLGLASIKDDPLMYRATCFDPELLDAFTKLKVLSIDYDMVSDTFLSKLECASNLEKLIIHLHSVGLDHPGTTDEAWGKFRKVHPECDLHLTVIHAFKDISELHSSVLRLDMPLTHLKMFFCEMANHEMIQNLTHYAKTLKSFVLIDSLSNNSNSYSFVRHNYKHRPDPFVLAAWLCKHLEEFVLYGYKYFNDNLTAIGRLRGKGLKKLEVVESDIVYQDRYKYSSWMELAYDLKKPWKAVKSSELHPVICSPTDGDSDEYILPIVLAELH